MSDDALPDADGAIGLSDKFRKMGEQSYKVLLNSVLEVYPSSTTKNLLTIIDASPDSGDLALAFTAVQQSWSFPMSLFLIADDENHKMWLENHIAQRTGKLWLDGAMASAERPPPKVQDFDNYNNNNGSPSSRS